MCLCLSSPSWANWSLFMPHVHQRLSAFPPCPFSSHLLVPLQAAYTNSSQISNKAWKLSKASLVLSWCQFLARLACLRNPIVKYVQSLLEPVSRAWLLYRTLTLWTHCPPIVSEQTGRPAGVKMKNTPVPVTGVICTGTGFHHRYVK